MPYLTTRKNLKLQLSPGLVASYDIQPGNGVGLFWDNTHPGPTRRQTNSEPNNLYCESTNKLLSSTLTIATYYYSAWKLILILHSHGA